MIFLYDAPPLFSLYNYILIYEKGKSRDAPALAVYML